MLTVICVSGNGHKLLNGGAAGGGGATYETGEWEGARFTAETNKLKSDMYYWM